MASETDGKLVRIDEHHAWSTPREFDGFREFYFIYLVTKNKLFLKTGRTSLILDVVLVILLRRVEIPPSWLLPVTHISGWVHRGLVEMEIRTSRSGDVWAREVWRQ
jgi:hypothetical protein